MGGGRSEIVAGNFIQPFLTKWWGNMLSAHQRWWGTCPHYSIIPAVKEINHLSCDQFHKSKVNALR